nr:phage portal protein [Brevibacillus laterosporus]
MLYIMDVEEPNSIVIKTLISKHKSKREKMITRYKRYTLEDVPIFKREFLNKDKVNNKINTDFTGDIINQKVGYVLGNPIMYGFDRKSKNYKISNDILSDFLDINNAKDADSEWAKMASICGYASRLFYIEKNTGNLRFVNIKPWETIFITQNGIDTKQALRYYEVLKIEDDKEVSRKKAEWYTDREILFFEEEKNGNFKLTNRVEHLLKHVPLIILKNNDELNSDVEGVIEKIDDYDRGTSDLSSEIEQIRLAYLVLDGVEMSPETAKSIQQTGMIKLPSNPNGGNTGQRVYYITKQLDDKAIENHLKRTEEDIYMVTGAINTKDENIGSNVTGPAMKHRLQKLENKCTNFENKMRTALKEQFKIVVAYWNTLGETLNPSHVIVEFKRKFPFNLVEEADAASKLVGIVSNRTLLGALSIVDDPDWEIEQIRKESEERDKHLTTSYNFPTDTSITKKNGLEDNGE